MRGALAFALVTILTVSLAPADDIKLVNGEVLKDAKITSQDSIGVTITHSGGIARIPYESLPADLRQRFNYDPAKAHEQADAEARSAVQRAQQEQSLRNQPAEAHAASQKVYDVVLKDVPGARAGTERILEVSFYSNLPAPKIIDKMLRDSLEQATSIDGTRDVLAMAFFGEEALTETQYTGELVYRASDRKIVTLEEYRKSPHSANF